MYDGVVRVEIDTGMGLLCTVCAQYNCLLGKKLCLQYRSLLRNKIVTATQESMRWKGWSGTQTTKALAVKNIRAYRKAPWLARS